MPGSIETHQLKPHQGAQEVPLSRMLPFSSLVTEHDMATRGGHYMRFFELEPAPFETADPIYINGLHEAQCAWLATLTDDFVVYRYRVQFYEESDLPHAQGSGYAPQFYNDYAALLKKKPFLINRMFLVLLYAPAREKGTRTRAQIERDQAEALQVLEERTAGVLRMLGGFSPKLLGDVERDGVMFSRPAEFAALLVNGKWMRVRAGLGPLHRTLPAVRASAADGVVELRGIADTRYVAMLDVYEYCDEPQAGFLTELLYEPIEYIEAQSFKLMSRRRAMKSMDLQMRHLETAADKVRSQIDALKEAIDLVGAGQMAWGEHYGSLAFFGDSVQEARRTASEAAATVMERTGINLQMTDLLADNAWLAQCPGNLWHRTRNAEMSSRAFAALNGGHGFFRGKEDGNPWGPCVGVMRSSSGSKIFVSWHASPLNEDNYGQSYPANTLFTGRTRSGKTTGEAAMLLLSFLLPQRPRILIFDKDRGLEIFVRRMGGIYLRLREGEPTGVNPLQWPLTPKLRAFLQQWISQLMGGTLDADELADLEFAIDTVLGMDWGMRNLSHVWQMLPVNGPNGKGNSMRARLGRWIAGGAMGWAFDVDDDRLPRELTIAGYDYTEFLDHPELRSPMVMALLEYGESFLDGTPFIQVVAETWRAVKDKAMAKFLHDKSKTIGKLGGVLVMDTQEPNDLVDHSDSPDSIGNTLVSQTPTICCFHDSESPDEPYLKTLRLTEAELRLVRTLNLRPGRSFLFKQNGQSAIVEFDLKGIPDHIVALSGSEKNTRLLDEIRAEVGDDPEVWWPVLLQRVHERDHQARIYQLETVRKAA